MPTAIIEGPPLPIEKKRMLVSSVADIVGRIYDWPAERIVINPMRVKNMRFFMDGIAPVTG